MDGKSLQAELSSWIIKKLKKAEGNTIGRQLLWRLYTVDPNMIPGSTSAAFSVALKTLLNNGIVEITFINNVKHVKLK
jgi:hypothetical protein